MTTREGIMLAVPFDSRRFERYNKPCFVQPKFEGDRCRAVFDSRGKVTLFSSSSKVRDSVPHINWQLESLNLHDFELDGELYIHGMPHEEIRSIVSRTVNRHPRSEIMEYHVFDAVLKDVSQRERFGALYTAEPMMSPRPAIKFVGHQLASTPSELHTHYEAYLNEGYEGIIIRDPLAFYKRSAPGHATCLMKLKPRLSATYEIVGTEEEISIKGEPKRALGALRLKTDEGKVFSVGSGFTRAQREYFWSIREKLIGKQAKIRFQALTEDRQVPKMQSFEELIL